MTIETTILDFQLSNTFEQYESHMNAEEQQSMFKEMGVKTFYIGKSLDDPAVPQYSYKIHIARTYYLVENLEQSFQWSWQLYDVFQIVNLFAKK